MDMDLRISRRTALTTGLIGAGALAAGCAPAKQDGLPVTILSSQGPQVLTIQQLITDKGYLKEVGLAPNMVPVASGTNIIGPLLTGNADICIFAGFSQLLSAIEKGAALKILGGASISGQQALFSKNPAVQHVKDLEGHTVGVGAIGAQLHQVVTALLRKKGVDISKVKFVVIGSSGDVFKSVVTGKVDAGNGQADILSSLDKLGVHMIQDGEYAKELPEYTWQASFASEKAIAEKREALVRTLEVYARAFRYSQSDPASKDDFIKAHNTALGARDEAQSTEEGMSQWNYLQQRKIYAEDLVISPERVEYMQKLNVDLGAQKTVLPYEKIVDLSLAQEAIARLSNKAKPA
jgi:ABC-type nitrate/sulfonate/bicarbonate transport system substrate-binding protein